MENINPEVKKKVDTLIANGHHEAKFKYLQHAKYMHGKLVSHGLEAKILEKFGHAVTVDAKAGEVLTKHFHVYGESTAAHRVLGKFV